MKRNDNYSWKKDTIYFITPCQQFRNREVYSRYVICQNNFEEIKLRMMLVILPTRYGFPSPDTHLRYGL